MRVNDEEYKNHHVFLELEGYIDFYKTLSRSVFTFSAAGVNVIRNIDSYVFSSIQGTLESIMKILINGRINDAYALLRKYYDSAIINIYSNLYLEDHSSIESYIVDKINNWLKGKEKLPEYRIMSNYIRKSEKLTPINDLLYMNDRYKKIRDRCNNHTHYNFFYNVLLNDSGINLDNRLQVLETFSADVRDIFILHLAYIFSLNEHYMSSSDYMDSLECDMIPVTDSQYWVASFVQDVFDDIITKERSDITAAIKKFTCMQLL